MLCQSESYTYRVLETIPLVLSVACHDANRARAIRHPKTTPPTPYPTIPIGGAQAQSLKILAESRGFIAMGIGELAYALPGGRGAY